MGIFGRKQRHPLAGLDAYDLKQGTTIALVDVEPAFIDYARANRPKKPRLGHESPIALVLSGDDVVAYYDDLRVGRMDPSMVGLYRSEFDQLARAKRFGRTVIYVKPEGAKSPHAVALNWGVGAFEGGIL
jgi:hypothetical protein